MKASPLSHKASKRQTWTWKLDQCTQGKVHELSILYTPITSHLCVRDGAQETQVTRADHLLSEIYILMSSVEMLFAILCFTCLATCQRVIKRRREKHSTSPPILAKMTKCCRRGWRYRPLASYVLRTELGDQGTSLTFSVKSWMRGRTCGGWNKNREGWGVIQNMYSVDKRCGLFKDKTD